MSQPALLIGQSGGPTAVLNASLAGVIEAAQASGAFARILGLRHGIEGALAGQAGDLIPLDSLGATELEALAATPAAALGSCRHKLEPDDYERLLDCFRAHEVRWFCYIGGNDSMDTGHRLAMLAEQTGYDLAVFGVPKTIDNDLVETDHCPGYGSAARFWAVTAQEASVDLAAMRTYDRVLILECMGRNAGWLTAATAIYRRDERTGPHLLLPPERPFEEQRFLADVERVLSRVGYCVVAAAETIRDTHGQLVAPPPTSPQTTDRFGHPLVAETGELLAQRVTAGLGVKARVNKPGTLQRCSTAHVSPVDRAEARRAGQEAARRLARGERGGMVTLQRAELGEYRCEFGVAPLEQVANRERKLPAGYLVEDGSDVTAAFRAYAAPLLGPAPPPLFWLA